MKKIFILAVIISLFVLTVSFTQIKAADPALREGYVKYRPEIGTQYAAPNVTIQMFDKNNVLRYTTVSNSIGFYQFANIDCSNIYNPYTIVVPNGYTIPIGFVLDYVQIERQTNWYDCGQNYRDNNFETEIFIRLKPAPTPTPTPTPSPTPVNNPPTCGNPVVSFSNNRNIFLPTEEVNITATGFADMDGDTVRVTNWVITPGAILNYIDDQKTITYKSPNNQDTIYGAYVISDSKSTTWCSFTAQTKVAYSCTDTSCNLDPLGSYNSTANCMENCPGSGNYSCTPSGSCTYDPIGGIYSDPTCNNMCSPAEVRCDGINVKSGSLSTEGSTVTLTGTFYNFPTNGSPSTYEWISSSGSVDISNDPNCNQTTRICTMPLNKAFESPIVSYNTPTLGNIGIKVNNNTPASSCLINFDNSSSKDVNLQFSPSTYSGTIGSTVTAKLEVLPVLTPPEIIQAYVVELVACSYKDSSNLTQNCIGNVSFDPSDTNVKMSSLANLSSAQFKDVYVNFNLPYTLTITAKGYTPTTPPALQKTAIANITYTTPVTLNVKKVVAENTDFRLNKQDYCTRSVPGTGINSVETTIYDSISNVISNANLNSSYAVTLNSGTYNIQSSYTASKSEIKCILYSVGNSVVTSTSATLGIPNSPASTMVTVVVGPKEGTTWYQAVGGSMFSSGNAYANIPQDITEKFLTDGTPSIGAGVFETNTVSSSLSQHLPFYRATHNTSSGLNFIDILKLDLDDSGTPISNLSSVSNNSNITKFYRISGNTTINSNFEVDTLTNKIPVVFIDGNVTIASSVTKLDMFIISTGSITLGNTSADLIQVRGGLLAKGSFSFISPLSVQSVDGKLTEQIFFDPGVYFSNDSTSLYFKNINIFASVID